MWCQILGLTLPVFHDIQKGALPAPPAPQEWQRAEEGFIDQHGKFYSRAEAWPVALRNDQILRYELDSKWQTGSLHSEHLY